jgi:hypothetical protein
MTARRMIEIARYELTQHDDDAIADMESADELFGRDEDEIGFSAMGDGGHFRLGCGGNRIILD